MAKCRDKLFFEYGVSEADIERTIKELKLVSDFDFQTIMDETEKGFAHHIKSV